MKTILNICAKVNPRFKYIMQSKPIYKIGDYKVTIFNNNDEKIKSFKCESSLIEAQYMAKDWMRELGGASYKVLRVIIDSKYNVHAPK